MSDQIPYLSDEELQKLMASVEAEPPVKAPDDLEEKVIARIVSRERKKTVDFTRYCMRVGFAVAAAVALLCIVPFVSEDNFGKTVAGGGNAALLTETIPTKAEVIKSQAAQTKEEVLKGLYKPTVYEALKNYVDDVKVQGNNQEF
ncbi:MAG: hypothetical protein K6F75_01245 [Butyrivibrio sp.]|nr:hypothetical protein [Butyrivibrio sp.]